MDKQLEEKIDEKAAMSGAIRPTAKYCKTCKWSHGEAPWADVPDKANCLVFRYEDRTKPHDILFNDAECDFYEEEYGR